MSVITSSGGPKDLKTGPKKAKIQVHLSLGPVSSEGLT